MAAPKDVCEALPVLQIETEEEICWDVFTEEILPRIPTKHLLKLKSVCRNWYQAVLSPYFVGLHLKMNNQSQIRVLIPQNSEMMMIEEYKRDPGTTLIPYPPPIHNGTPQILGSCNGLSCFLHRKLETVVVYNPSTREYFSLQLSLCLEIDIKFASCFWFGQHPSTGEYVLVWGNGRNYKFGVHKLSRTSHLKPIRSTSCIHRPKEYSIPIEERGTLLHGALHWPALHLNIDGQLGYIISAYHLNNNKYFEISPPAPAPAQSTFTLGVNAEERLFAFMEPAPRLESRFEIWVMEKYGVQQSWTKYANIEGFNSCLKLSPVGFCPDGDLILDVDNRRLIKYNFNHSKGMLLVEHEICETAFMCVDSLVSPDSII